MTARFPAAMLLNPSGWKKQGAFHARFDCRSGEGFNTPLFPALCAVQAVSLQALAVRVSQPTDGC